MGNPFNFAKSDHQFQKLDDLPKDKPHSIDAVMKAMKALNHMLHKQAEHYGGKDTKLTQAGIAEGSLIRRAASDLEAAEFYEEVTMAQLADVEKFADKLWGKLGIDVKFTKHFIDRMNDERNGKPISAAELVRLFKKEYEQQGKGIAAIDADGEALMVDIMTSVNLPFVLKADGTLVAKTVMRKDNFKTNDPTFKVK